MDLNHITFQGPPVEDNELIPLLPPALRAVLEQINGFIQFGGGLHVRGACLYPHWHSLRRAWMSKEAFHQFYRTISETDIPFGQDCLGNQFLLRGEEVVKLDGETGELEELGGDLLQFLEAAQAEPNDFLRLEVLTSFRDEGGELAPGQLLQVEPPLSTPQAADGISLTSVPALQRLAFLREYHRQIKIVS